MCPTLQAPYVNIDASTARSLMREHLERNLLHIRGKWYVQVSRPRPDGDNAMWDGGVGMVKLWYKLWYLGELYVQVSRPDWAGCRD